jgi:D-alanyl-D-alanine carboxypeptidase
MAVGTLKRRRGCRRAIALQLAAACTAALFFFHSGAAEARYSSIVIEAETGKVVSEANADQPNYPASLTKMMTLYLLFDALEQGKVTLDQRFTVSQHAANQAPSKLGLVPGETIAVRDAILGLVTKSANDVAVTVAENLGGSEPAFAERMTQKAHALGMSHTLFRNASGLPNPLQKTTARDLSRLALALYRDHPKEYAYFATEEFSFHGMVHHNHNHLMSAFEGMDGIKTGYIRASGFNLAASAVRDNRRLIGVVMGGESAHSRDLKMAQLLNNAFAGRAEAPVEVAEDETTEEQPPAKTIVGRAGRALRHLSPVAAAEAAQPSAPAHARHAARWSIQVGAFSQHAAAEKAGAAALARLPVAKGKAVVVVAPSHHDKAHYYRARITHFSEGEAQRACQVLRKKHKQCAVVAPGGMQMASAL